ncbi:MAG TPA: phosphoribosylamine--glycine ligase [Candidatus Angelobacter sp.]
MNKSKKILIYGKDARTDAIVDACFRSQHRPEIYVCTEFNNPGFLRKSKGLRLLPKGGLSDLSAMVNVAEELRPDFVIVGPEEPLGAGLVDRLEQIGIPSVGPYLQLAQIETSKSWARELVSRVEGRINPEYRIFKSASGLKEFLQELGGFVIKPDGLTGGKGVRVSGEHLSSADEGVTYAKELLALHPCIVAEQKLEGEEFSLQTISDGYSFVHCPLAQDHKRAFENDLGPNTGGMGSYSCSDWSLPFLRTFELEEAKRINCKVLNSVREETGKPYRGVLYGNYIATREGVKLIEYNARFADPESMNILSILDTDFVDICEAVLSKSLAELKITFRRKATVCKYVVPEEYPGKPKEEERISVSQELFDREELRTYFAAVNSNPEGLYLTGSRAVALVGIGETLQEAERIAEKAANAIEGPVRHRKDVGSAKLVQSRVLHMQALREHRSSAGLSSRFLETALN